MLTILTPRTTHHVTEYRREWIAQVTGAGFAFPCAQDGTIDRAALPPSAVHNLDACLRGDHADLVDLGVLRTEWDYTVAAVARCACGGTVDLVSDRNACDRCGADYNACGQALRPLHELAEDE